MSKTAHCEHCDSENISGTASAAFNGEEWVIGDMVNNIECEDCGEPCGVVYKNEKGEVVDF